MEKFVAIVKSTDGKLDKYQDFAVKAKAVKHVKQYGGFVVPNPGGHTDYWVIDELAKTVVNDQVQADADALANSWDKLRSDRNSLLVFSDWTQFIDSPLDDETKDDWATYRQELRDLPDTTDDPGDPTWPEMLAP